MSYTYEIYIGRVNVFAVRQLDHDSRHQSSLAGICLLTRQSMRGSKHIFYCPGTG